MPQLLLTKARLEEDVVVIGKGRHLEVVNRDRFEVNLENNPMTADDMASLASFRYLEFLSSNRGEQQRPRRGMASAMPSRRPTAKGLQPLTG